MPSHGCQSVIILACRGTSRSVLQIRVPVGHTIGVYRTLTMAIGSPTGMVRWKILGAAAEVNASHWAGHVVVVVGFTVFCFCRCLCSRFVLLRSVVPITTAVASLTPSSA